MFTTSYRDNVLNLVRTSALATWTAYISLLTSINNFRTGTVSEATYTGYGTRPSATFGAPTDTSPVGGRQIANSGLVDFPQNTGSNQDVLGFGVHDAATSGNLRMIGFLDAHPPILGTATVADTITAPAHGLANAERVFVLAAPGAVIPTGLSENTAYYVINTATDTFQLSLTNGGAAVDITVSGAALFMPYAPVTIATNATPEFAVGALVLQI